MSLGARGAWMLLAAPLLSGCPDWSSLYVDCDQEDCGGATYNSMSDHSDTQGANGWSYLYSQELAAFGMMVFNPDDSWWYCGGGECILTPQGGLPDKSYFSVRRWTAPRAARIAVTGAVRTIDVEFGDGELIEIRHQGELLWSQAIGPTDGLTYLFDVRIVVADGDAIDFIIGNGGDGDNDGDWINFDSTVTVELVE